MSLEKLKEEYSDSGELVSKYRTWYGFDFEIVSVDQLKDAPALCDPFEQKITLAKRSSLDDMIHTPQEMEKFLYHEKRHADIFPIKLGGAYLASLYTSTLFYSSNDSLWYNAAYTCFVALFMTLDLLYLESMLGVEERLVQYLEKVHFCPRRMLSS